MYLKQITYTLFIMPWFTYTHSCPEVCDWSLLALQPPFLLSRPCSEQWWDINMFCAHLWFYCMRSSFRHQYILGWHSQNRLLMKDGSGHNPWFTSRCHSCCAHPCISPIKVWWMYLSVWCKLCNNDSDKDKNNFQPTITTGNITNFCCKMIHCQHIESKQRCCNKLCDSYHWLEDTLPISNQKSSKVLLLNHTTTHIKYLKMTA